jgi:hypothetical protein
VTRALGWGPAKQRLPGNPLAAEDARLFVGEPGCGSRDRDVAGHRLEEARLAADAPVAANPDHEIADGVRGPVEAVTQLDDLVVQELRRMLPNSPRREFAPLARHVGARLRASSERLGGEVLTAGPIYSAAGPLASRR